MGIKDDDPARAFGRRAWQSKRSCRGGGDDGGGGELEVFGHSFLYHNKTQNLVAEKEGRRTCEVPMRNQHEENIWIPVTAQDPSEDFDENYLVLNL